MSLGGKGGGSKPPKAPKPQDVIAAQEAANSRSAQLSAQLNRVNQVTPFGNLTYTQNPKNKNQYTATQTLDPLTLASIQGQTRLRGDQSKLADQFLPNVASSLTSPFSLDTFKGDRQRVEDALVSRLNPYLDRQQEQLNTSLANQGVSLGSDQYGTAQKLFGNQKNDAYQQAILQANDEQGKQFQLAQAEQNQPLNQYLALAGDPTIQGPSYTNTPYSGVPTTDASGIIQGLYNSQLNAFNNAQSNSQAGKGNILGLAGSLGSAGITGGLFGGGGAGIAGGLGSLSAIDAAALASSRQFKNELGPADDVLASIETLPLQRWSYKWDGMPHMGPYAEDWQDRFGGLPDSIHVADAFGVALKAIQELTARVKELEARHG